LKNEIEIDKNKNIDWKKKYKGRKEKHYSTE
jgi:hypothetical protein